MTRSTDSGSTQPRYSVLFLKILGAFTAVFIGYLIYSHHVFCQSQDNVKTCYVEHIKRADSLHLNILRYNKDVVVNIQKIFDATLADSMIKASLMNTRHLSKAQSNNLGVIIESHFSKIESLHEKYGEKLFRDSVRLGVERDLLNGQTKAMIDLHLNKIEHEYSNITLWAAILTILFLVFSFYSVFKADELIKQGTDGLNEIRQIKAQGEQTVEELTAKGENILEQTEAKINTFILRQQRSMLESSKLFEEKKSDIDRLHSESLGSLAAIKDSFGEQTKDTLRKFEAEIEKLRLEKERELSLQQEEFKRLIVEINAFFAHLKEQKPAEEQEPKDTKEEDKQ